MASISQDAEDAEDAALIIRYYYEHDSKAFNRLYERYRRKLYSYLRRKGGDVNLADDLFQDTWNKVIESIARIAAMAQQGILKFAAYLFTIARNLWLDYIRAKGYHEDSLDTLLEDEAWQIADDSTKQPPAQLELQELIALFSAAINKIPVEQRETFILRRQGFSLENIAEIQGLTREGVRSRLKTVMRKLKPILDQWRAS